MKTIHPIPFAALAFLMFAFGSPHARAQQSIETSDGMLRLVIDMPTETRAGESFSYTIKATNNSDQMTLRNVQLKQEKVKGFTVESVSVQPSQNKANSSKDSESSQSATNSQEQQQGQDQGQQQAQNSQAKMTIDALEPGETRTIEVKAAADEEGQLRTCLEVVSYTPAICLTSKVVRPKLELTKTAPEQANRCRVIELEYTLKNGGTGDVAAIQITDDLGEGLATIEGNQNLKFDIDSLEAGETRKFVARVYARKPGEFSSRAIAKAENSELSSRSQRTTTRVNAAELDVQVTGTERLYGDQLAQFTATVTNRGDADAEDVRVNLQWPDQANLVDLSTVRVKQSSDQNQQSSPQSNQDNRPTTAESRASTDGANGTNGDQNGDAAAEMRMADRTMMIDRLKAGQTAEFTYAIRPGQLKTIPTKVKAHYVCTVSAAEDEAKARSETTSMAMATAKVVRLPALQLVAFDDEDPVSQGSEIAYTIRVWNEGDAPDQNVQIAVNLPEGLEFKKADGPTDHSMEGSKVVFEPIDTLQPGERREYQVMANSIGSGSVRVAAELTSQMLSQPVVAEEPTRLFDRQARR